MPSNALGLISLAKTFGKIIIAEAFVPNEFKTIEPLPESEVGGQAGNYQ
jgi:hypothetical protein